jgi:hypothetical protein
VISDEGSAGRFLAILFPSARLARPVAGDLWQWRVLADHFAGSKLAHDFNSVIALPIEICATDR